MGTMRPTAVGKEPRRK